MANNKTNKSSMNEGLRFSQLDDRLLFSQHTTSAYQPHFLCAGFQLLSVDKADPRKALFIFQKKMGLKMWRTDTFRTG